MYPHGDPQHTPYAHPTGGPLPASTILVLESAATALTSLVPQLTSAGYTVTQTTDPDEAFAKIVEHQLAILDVGVADAAAKPTKAAKEPKEPKGREGREGRQEGVRPDPDRHRAMPRDPGYPSHGRRAHPVRSQYR